LSAFFRRRRTEDDDDELDNFDLPEFDERKVFTKSSKDKEGSLKTPLPAESYPRSRWDSEGDSYSKEETVRVKKSGSKKDFTLKKASGKNGNRSSSDFSPSRNASKSPMVKSNKFDSYRVENTSSAFDGGETRRVFYDDRDDDDDDDSADEKRRSKSSQERNGNGKLSRKSMSRDFYDDNRDDFNHRKKPSKDLHTDKPENEHRYKSTKHFIVDDATSRNLDAHELVRDPEAEAEVEVEALLGVKRPERNQRSLFQRPSRTSPETFASTTGLRSRRA